MSDKANPNTINNLIAKNITMNNINKNSSANIILDKLKNQLIELKTTTKYLEISIFENINAGIYFKKKKARLDQLLDESEKVKNKIDNNKENILIINSDLMKSNRHLKKFNNMARDNNRYNQHIKYTENNIFKKIKTLDDNMSELLINRQKLSNNNVILNSLRKEMNAIVHHIGDNIDFRIQKGKEIENLKNSISDCFTELNEMLPLTKSQDKRAQEINKKCNEILFVEVVSMGEANDILKIENKKIEKINFESYKNMLDFKSKIVLYLNPESTTDSLNNIMCSFNYKSDISNSILFNRNVTNGCNILIATTKH